MGSYREIKGDLIELAKLGEFDVVVHGCNCFNTMGAGIAVKFAEVFGADRFEKEHHRYRGDINKLGTIDYEKLYLSKWDNTFVRNPESDEDVKETLVVVNLYSQYRYGKGKYVDYEALRLGLRKVNTIFSGLRIGLPQIGCGLAGGDWFVVQSIIQREVGDTDTTVVIYDK